MRNAFGDIPNPDKALAELEKQGYKANEDGTVTTPDGKRLSQSDLTSALNGSEEGRVALQNIKDEVKRLSKKQRRYEQLVQRFRARNGGGYANQARGKSKSRRSSRNYGVISGGLSRTVAKTKKGPVTYVKGDPISAENDNLLNIIEGAYGNMRTQKTLKQPGSK